MIRRNFPYVRAQVAAAFASTSPFVRILSGVIILCYALSFSSAAIDAFCVRPGLFFPPKFRIWTFATHSFMETHWWHALVDIIIINLYGKLLEPLWGTIEMINFYLLVNTVAGIATSFIYVMLYGLTFDPSFLFDIRIHGLPGYIAAFSVAVKQVCIARVALKGLGVVVHCRRSAGKVENIRCLRKLMKFKKKLGWPMFRNVRI